jgi:agmatinase
VATTVVIFPFDLFGGSGSGAGAELIADELRTILADNRRERTPTRARAYQDQVRIKQVAFESLSDMQAWRERGRRAARQVLQKDDFFLWIAGNHLGVLPLYDELSADPRRPVVVQFDAHLDIHSFSDLSPEPSHGNFLLHCAGPLPRVINVGHRELLLRDEDIRQHFHAALSAEALAEEPSRVLGPVTKTARDASRLILDIDWDILDPAFFPAVSRSVPFGLTPQQLLQVINAVWSDNVVGVAVSEFDPARDHNDRSLALVMWLLEWLLLKRYDR